MLSLYSIHCPVPTFLPLLHPCLTLSTRSPNTQNTSYFISLTTLHTPPPIYPMPSFLLAQPCSPHYVPITKVTLSYHYSHLIHLSFSFKVAQLYTFKPRQISSNSVAQTNINTFPDLILPRVFPFQSVSPFLMTC